MDFRFQVLFYLFDFVIFDLPFHTLVKRLSILIINRLNVWSRRLNVPGGTVNVLGSISGLNRVETRIFGRDHFIFLEKGFLLPLFRKKINLQIKRARRIGQHIGFSFQLKPEIKLVFFCLRPSVFFLEKGLDIRYRNRNLRP